MSSVWLWYSEEGLGRAEAPHSPFLAVPNVTAHPSTASVTITVYDGPFLCGFNMAIKGLSSGCKTATAKKRLVKPRSQIRWLYAIALSFCLSVRLFVRSLVCRL